MMQAPVRRWPALSLNEAEELRGMKPYEWQTESWLHKNRSGAKWAAIPARPIAPHKLDVPLNMWFEQRGLN